MRYEQILSNKTEIHDKLFVKRSDSHGIHKDVERLAVLHKILSPEFNRDHLERTLGVSLEILIDEQSHRWHWLQSKELSDKLVSRCSLTSRKNYTYLVGLTGEGESTTFNSLLGSKLAKVGNQRGTTKVTRSSPDHYLVDTPGLKDDNNLDIKIISTLQDEIHQRASANLVLFIKQKAARFDSSEQEALGVYKDIFGDNFKHMLRIVCTNVPVLMPAGEMTTDDQVTMDSFTNSAKEQFEKLNLGTNSDFTRPFFIGDVPGIPNQEGTKTRFLREGAPDPSDELEKLRTEILNSKPNLTISASRMKQLLENSMNFWKNEQAIREVTKQSLRVISSQPKEDPKYRKTETYSCLSYTYRGPIRFLSWIPYIPKFGEYDRKALNFIFHMSDKGKNLLSNVSTFEELEMAALHPLDQTPKMLIVFVGKSRRVDQLSISTTDRVLTETYEFEVIAYGSDLNHRQRQKIASSVLGNEVMKEEIIAARELYEEDSTAAPSAYI